MHSNHSSSSALSPLAAPAAAVILLLGVACSNPADDVSEAVVEEVAAATDDGSAEASGTVYTLADGTRVGFEGSKVTGSHVGGFENVEGSIELVDGDPTQSKVTIDIDMTSVWSDNERLTGHLKSPDFFDVETHPSARFESTSITAAEDGYSITGNLDFHGVEKSITFPAAISVEEGQVTADAEFFIKRFDFGVEYPGKADDLIRDEVVIRLELVAQPAAS